MKRRHLFAFLSALGLPRVAGASPEATAQSAVQPLRLADAEWQKKRLSGPQYDVLRREGTERVGSSPLNAEKRKDRYHCAGCDLPLFDAAMKFDSGTGWPSFFSFLPSALQTKTDFKLLFPRTEYHCVRCEGHQGHVFNDGPAPTGKRYCNNGVALKFVEAVGAAPRRVAV